MLGEADRQRRAFSEFRLPPGRHGISPEDVAENQRWRLLGAAAEVLAESGYVQTTSTRVSKHAGVSPATFYQHFENIGECLLAAYETAVGLRLGDRLRGLRRGADRVAEAGSASPSPPRSASSRWSRRWPISSATRRRPGSRRSPAARQAAIGRFAELLANGRSLRPEDADELPAGTERHLVAGALAIYSERVAAGDVERLPELAPAAHRDALGAVRELGRAR